jgi:hypothetical protein
LGICATKSIARQKLREFLEREDINSLKSFRQNTAPGVTFRQQAEWWLAELSSRRSRPVKPATISGWRDALSAWLLPNLGDKLLAEVSNKAVRELVEKMSVANLSPKTVVNYVQVVTTKERTSCSARCEACGIPCLSAFPDDVAEKESRPT